MSDFIVEGLTKSVGDKTVFKAISFIIHDLDRIGLIGVNGTGKTTLLDVLADKIGFDGDVSPFLKAKDYKIAYLTQEPDFDDSKTVLDTVLSSDLKEMALIRQYEELMLHYDETNQEKLEQVMTQMDSLDAWTIESEVKTVLSKLGIVDLTQKVGQLSGGLRRRVQLAQVLLGDADLLLLDEPTNHLDIETIAWLTNFLKTSKKTVFFITHDRYFLDNVATRIFELDHAQLTEYQGNYQDYVRLKAERDEREAASLHKKKQLYKQELAWMRTQPQARATKQQARINRFQELKGQVQSTSMTNDLEINFQTSRIGKKVLNFKDVSFAYPDKPILKDFNLLVQNKDRIGIVGDNGVGKSTLLNLINGDLQPNSGQLEIGETVRIGYFSQQIMGMDESKRVINYLQEVADEVKTTVGTTSITELLEQFLFSRSSHGTQIAKLSGGEKKRLYLLKILIEKPNVLLLDEPTNDLDIATLTVLENFLQGFGGAVITVSHDRYFLDKVANKILAFENGGVREFFGNYTDYLDEQEFLKNQASQVSQKSEKTDQEVSQEELASSSKKRMSWQEKQEWASIEDDIAELEDMIAAVEADMQNYGSDFTKLAELQKELDQLNQDLLDKYERYEYLSELEN
ncbi:ABC-F family ATP-binding cassette domain-containing protein [Streptococcus sobrinus]|uniref:ABC-F family ATP-binding cassette domain-containing protein n=1 Tax=Streptococcus sobrinus TaxID=1310 RepID=UPI00031C13A1|nr:ABC-F family ATP-binding cassette domain-containing protein [Streptococcus sobrinus]